MKSILIIVQNTLRDLLACDQTQFSTCKYQNLFHQYQVNTTLLLSKFATCQYFSLEAVYKLNGLIQSGQSIAPWKCRMKEFCIDVTSREKNEPTNHIWRHHYHVVLKDATLTSYTVVWDKIFFLYYCH